MIFIYGTLLDAVLRAHLLGRDVAVRPARVAGFHVVNTGDGPIPALLPQDGTLTEGCVLTDLTAEETQRLDAYEGAFDYQLGPVTVLCDGVETTALAYLPGPSVQVTDTPWSLDIWDKAKGPLSRERAFEIGQAVPPMDAASLRQKWKMIGSRAAARLRAAEMTAPSTMRYSPAKRDAVVTDRGPLFGDFFRFSQFDMQHRSFQGGTSPVLQREVFVGVDAALALPYDPKADTVLLVEQIRTGPLIRGDANPWALEPVAGMVDPGETPEDAALRETQEEANLTDVTLRKMFSFYTSPGSSTDYFYCYAALGNLPAPTTYTGGLEEEHEDLRLHVVPFADAMALIDTGEANVGPLITMLMWLDRHRESLRAAA